MQEQFTSLPRTYFNFTVFFTASTRRLRKIPEPSAIRRGPIAQPCGIPTAREDASNDFFDQSRRAAEPLNELGYVRKKRKGGGFCLIWPF